MDQVVFRPWIGSAYAQTRLLIVGESHYGRPDENVPSLTCDVVEKWRQKTAHLRFLTNLARLVTGQKADELDRDTALNTVAFYNYIQRLMALDNEERPTEEDFAGGQEPFLNLIKELKPRHILVASLGVYNALPPPAKEGPKELGGRARLISSYDVGEESPALTMAIPHPSRAPVGQWIECVRQFRALTSLND